MLPLLLTMTAHADGFGSARLLTGQPNDQGFIDCLNTEGCSENFLRFLTESMMEQGLTMQGLSLGLSPLAHDRDGFVLGGAIATSVFSSSI